MQSLKYQSSLFELDGLMYSFSVFRIARYEKYFVNYRLLHTYFSLVTFH